MAEERYSRDSCDVALLLQSPTHDRTLPHCLGHSQAEGAGESASPVVVYYSPVAERRASDAPTTE